VAAAALNASASSIATSATRSAPPALWTPSSSITVQAGQATASVSPPVAAASRTRSSLIGLARSCIHMSAPLAPPSRQGYLLMNDRRRGIDGCLAVVWTWHGFPQRP
jgi:hypothetical protein